MVAGKRGRPKGSRNRPKLQEHPKPVEEKAPAAAAGAGPGHNSGALTDEEKKALHYGSHVPTYEKALAAKKEADAELKNVCKRIKAEGGSVDDVKRTIALRADGGVDKLKAEIEAMLRVARWDGIPVQGSLFDEIDRTPSVDKAYEQGKIAGMSGTERRPPYDAAGPQAQEWLRGYADGRALAAAAIKKLEPEPTPIEKVTQAPAAPENSFNDAMDDAPEAEEAPAGEAGDSGNTSDPPFDPDDPGPIPAFMDRQLHPNGPGVSDTEAAEEVEADATA